MNQSLNEITQITYTQHISMSNSGMYTSTGNLQWKQCICCGIFTTTTCIRGACESCHGKGLCHDDV
jgi:hypothetical protein